MKRTITTIALAIAACLGTNANIATTQQRVNELAQIAYSSATVYLAPSGSCYHRYHCYTIAKSIKRLLR